MKVRIYCIIKIDYKKLVIKYFNGCILELIIGVGGKEVFNVSLDVWWWF